MRRPGFDTRAISRMTGSPSTYFSSILSSATPGRTCSWVKPRMYPSLFKTSSTLARNFEAGEAMTAWRALCPLRIRVSISPRGSLIVIGIFLPARLDHAWNLPGGGEFAQSDARQLEFPIIAARAAVEGATIANPRFSAVAWQLRELQLRRKPLFGRRVAVNRDRLQAGAFSGDALGELAPPSVFLDRTPLCHSG